ncbi:alpha/beta hydrolase (plasmid) [Saccharobesus litoralis]|uniref:Alpha/beta hydrolase n=1 Tax=Saccharobesus litoralis TaxID=2172099 RepID=A0A2S0VYE4_9ALTE|nr:alpha/beta hydrolase [Saccharobesus litoralis]AWB69239.1 alpha/beta hydrolase [Saccharobesus litoralis]
MNKTISTVLCLLTSFCCYANPYWVDDSYNVASRFAKYQQQDPNLSLPLLQFQAGQVIKPDVRYRQAIVSDKQQSASGDKQLQPSLTRDLHLDIFYPSVSAKSNQHKTLVLIHGGGWRSGNKSHLWPMANLLAQRGYTLVIPEYRLSVEAPYPAAINDIKAAIQWIRQQAQTQHIPSDNISLLGGSSGGHLAALIAYQINHDLSLPENQAHETATQQHTKRIAAVIDLDGVLDFTDPLALKYENRKGDKSAAALWLGGSWQQSQEIWQQASPTTYLSPQSPPSLIISSGQARFTAGKQRVKHHLTQHNIPYQYHEFDQVIHTFWLFEPYLSQSVKTIDNFLQSLAP